MMEEYCERQLIHIVKQGDNMYRLARFYKTTVKSIMMQNPNVNPYNMPIGSELKICPGPDFEGQIDHPATPDVGEFFQLGH